MVLGRPATAALAFIVMATGCGISNLAFRADHRVHFTAPKSRELVATPITLRWTISGGASPQGATFAIFLDRAPIRPGQALRAVAAGDTSCKHTAGCPDAEYLAVRQVFTTTDMTLTLNTVASRNSYQTTQVHEATIVLLDGTGHRVGEAAWYIDFRMRHRRLV
jgi:hypothetical protein